MLKRASQQHHKQEETLFQGALSIYCIWWGIYYSMIKQSKCSRTKPSPCFYRFTAFQSWKGAEMLSSSHVLQISRLRLQVYSHQTSPFQSITNTTHIPRGTVHCLQLVSHIWLEVPVCWGTWPREHHKCPVKVWDTSMEGQLYPDSCSLVPHHCSWF